MDSQTDAIDAQCLEFTIKRITHVFRIALDCYFGVRGNPTLDSSIDDETQVELFEDLSQADLFNLAPLTTSSRKTTTGPLRIVAARIDGREIHALASPAVTEIIMSFRVRMARQAAFKRKSSQASRHPERIPRNRRGN